MFRPAYGIIHIFLQKNTRKKQGKPIWSEQGGVGVGDAGRLHHHGEEQGEVLRAADGKLVGGVVVDDLGEGVSP